MYAILAELKHSTIREHCGEFAGQTGQNWWDEDDSANRANREFNNLRGLRAERTSESLFLRHPSTKSAIRLRWFAWHIHNGRSPAIGDRGFGDLQYCCVRRLIRSSHSSPTSPAKKLIRKSAGCSVEKRNSSRRNGI